MSVKTILTIAFLLILGVSCKPLTDYGYEDHYVFTNQTGHAFTLSNYTIHEWNEGTTRLNPGQDTTLVEAFENSGKRPRDFTPYSILPMASDSVVIQFEDGKRLVYKRDYTTGSGLEDRSVYNVKNYQSTVKAGIYKWQYTFDQQDYQRAK